MARATLSSTGNKAGFKSYLPVSNDTLLGMFTLSEPSGISTTSTPRLAAPDCCMSFFTPCQLYAAIPPATAPTPAPMAAALLLSPIRAPRPAPNAAPAPAPTAVRWPRLALSIWAHPAAIAATNTHDASRAACIDVFINFSLFNDNDPQKVPDILASRHVYSATE